MAIQRLTANNKKRQVGDRQGRLQRRLSSHGITFGIYLILAAISLAVFGQTIRYEFVNFDDDLYVYNTPAIQAGLTIKGIAAAFTSQHAHNWHPLTTISHMLDCQLYGLNAGGHHATNVILHTIAVLLLFHVLRQLTGAVWKSAIVAALFAIHPLHVESVAWISERKDVLSAVFFLLMLSAYNRYVRAASLARYLLVVVLFAAGLMSKPMLVSVPIVLLLLDYWPLGRFEESCSTSEQIKILNAANPKRVIQFLVVEKIPLFVLSAVVCVITFILHKRAAGAIPPLPFFWRVQNALVSYVNYALKTLWPTHLAVFYPHPNETLAIWKVSLAIAFLLAVWLAVDLMAVCHCWPQLAVATAAAIILALAWAAFHQTSYWRNSETLWTHALAVTSDNDAAHNNLGYLCVDRGELDEAISHFEAASRIRSSKMDPHYNVGSAFVEMNLADALSRKGQSDAALVHYEEAIRLQPNYADAYYNRGNVLLTNGRVQEAIADLQTALQIQPNDADAHTCLGNALLRQGSLKEAIAAYEKGAALAPNDPHSRNNIAWVLGTSSDASIRDGVKATEFAEQAVGLSGGRDPKFIRTLAAAYAESGRFPEAVTTAKQAVMIATMQSKSGLAHVLEEDVRLYRANIPLRGTKPA